MPASNSMGGSTCACVTSTTSWPLSSTLLKSTDGAYLQTCASVTNTPNAALKRGVVLLPKEFYAVCLSCHLGGLLEEGEIRGGKDESALDFLQSGGGGRLERGLVNAILTDPKDTETGNPNSL